LSQRGRTPERGSVRADGADEKATEDKLQAKEHGVEFYR